MIGLEWNRRREVVLGSVLADYWSRPTSTMRLRLGMRSDSPMLISALSMSSRTRQCVVLSTLNGSVGELSPMTSNCREIGTDFGTGRFVY